MGANISLPRPLPAVDVAVEKNNKKNREHLHIFETNKESGRILVYFYLIPTKISLKPPLKHCNIHFLTPSIAIQNGVCVKLSSVITSQQCHSRTQHFREQEDRQNDQSRPNCVPV